METSYVTAGDVKMGNIVKRNAYYYYLYYIIYYLYIIYMPKTGRITSHQSQLIVVNRTDLSKQLWNNLTSILIKVV